MKFSEILQGAVPLENGWQNIQPRISVILPTFNRHAEGRLLPCIQSVLVQSFQDFEFIIFDDGSSDGSAGVIRPLAEKDPRIVFIPLANNTGLPAVLVDAGILRARGEFTAFIFDDNTWHPQAMEKLLGAADSSRADVVHAGMSLQQSDGRSRPLGTRPATLASLELGNSIPNGAVLVRQGFWRRFGLFDPHLLLRRVCDWDLWLRAVRQGAVFQHLPLEIGVEYGLTLKTSLGNSIHWDYKLVTAYLQDGKSLPARTAALLPNAIPDYDILDNERILPCTRNWSEWEDYEQKIVQPYLERHPEVKYTPILRHNRRYDATLQPYQLNANRPIFHHRRRILLICESFNRLAAEWKSALSDDPNHILCLANPGSGVLFDPASLDQVIVLDATAPVLLPFLEKCGKSGVSRVFAATGKTLPPGFQALAAACDDGFTFQDADQPATGLHRVEFLPCPVELDESGPPLQRVIFAPQVPDLQRLAGQTGEETLQVITLPGGMPSLTPALQSKFRWLESAEPLSGWLARSQNTAWLIAPGLLGDLSGYERSLLREEALRRQSLLVEWNPDSPLPSSSALADLRRQAAADWKKETIGHHPQGRSLQLRNLATGVHLRARLARQHGKKTGREAQTLVFVNSRLFGGSEVYGFLTAWTLRRIGFQVGTCLPDFDHYNAGGAKMMEWLAERKMPIPTNAQYGYASRLFFDPDIYVEGVLQRSQPLARWISQQDADLVFCSGFIPEAILAAGRRLPVFAAFFPPWGYALNRMTFLRRYLAGLASDCDWALQAWGRWLPEPHACIPSLIESDRFTILNHELPAEPVQIALVGTMNQMKGHRQALLAVEQLVSEGFNIFLNIYGFELEMYAGFIQQMKKLAEHPLLKDRVKFHGFVDDALEINRQNHIVFSASLAEGLPQALAFHQAAGLLPVAAPAGGIPEIVLDGETGYLAGGFEVADLAGALRRALQHRSDWPRLVANGRRLLMENASEQVFVSRLLAWMERGLEIHQSAGRRYFVPRPAGRPSAANAGESAPVPQQNFQTPVSSAILDESRMVCSPPLSRAPLVYTLNPGRDVLDGVRLRLATFLTQPQGELQLELFAPGSQQPLRRVILPASAALDNAWMKISIEPLHNLLGRTLEVHLSASLQQGRLAVYELPAQAGNPGLPQQAVKLGRRLLPLTSRRAAFGVFSAEDE